MATYAAPVVARAQDAGEWTLYASDDKIDYVVSTADSAFRNTKKTLSQSVSSVKQMHESNVKTFSETSTAYFAWVHQFAEWAKERLNPVKGGQAALDGLNAALAKAKAATDPDVALQLATDAWSSFASVPIVHKLLETADPVTSTAYSSFLKLHDSIVSWKLYKTAVDTGASTLSWATSTLPYKLGAQYVYPFVQPFADPAIANISKSDVYKNVTSYWKPAIAA